MNFSWALFGLDLRFSLSPEPQTKSTPYWGTQVSCLYSSGSQLEPILPPGNIWLCQETYLVVITGCGGCCWHVAGRRQGCCYTLSMHRTPHEQKMIQPQMLVVPTLRTLLYRVLPVCRTGVWPCLSRLGNCGYEFLSIPFSNLLPLFSNPWNPIVSFHCLGPAKRCILWGGDQSYFIGVWELKF